MKTLLILNAAIAAAAIGSVSAEEMQPPLMKEGLWENHSSQTMMGRTFQTTIKICQSIDAQKKEREFAAKVRERNKCTVTMSQPSPGVYLSESRCALGASAGSVSRSTMTFQGDGSYRVETRMTIAGNDHVSVMDAKYVGPCPPDMKPGDTLMPDGRKINVTGN